jgi:hypothetical protein
LPNPRKNAHCVAEGLCFGNLPGFGKELSTEPASDGTGAEPVMLSVSGRRGSQVGEWLRKRAATLRDFLAENNPHRKRADRWLVSMTHNVKRITGSYQDRLVALVLAATSPTGAENEEQLKKRRRRERIREWLDFLEMRRKHAAVETTGDIENG